MPRFWEQPASAILLIFIVAILQACGSLANHNSAQAMQCGPALSSSEPYAQVLGPLGQSLEGADLEALDLRTGEPISFSEKGCFSLAGDRTVIVRTRQHNWGVVVDTADLASETTIRLEDINDNTVALSCASDPIPSLNKDAAWAAPFIETQDSPQLRGLRVDFVIRGSDPSHTPLSGSFGLASGRGQEPGLELTQAGTYSVDLMVYSFFRKRVIQSRTCPFRWDNQAPDISLQVSGRRDQGLIELQGRSVLGVDGSDLVSFAADEADVREVSYCAVRLDEDFFPTEPRSLEALPQETLVRDCAGRPRLTAKPGAGILPDNRHGLWAVTFRAIDAAGNESPARTSLLLFYSQDRLNYLNSLSQYSIPDKVRNGYTLEAVTSALDVYERSQALATSYEWKTVKDSLRIAMAQAYFQDAVRLRNYQDSNTVTHMVFSPDMKYLIHAINPGLVVIRDYRNDERRMINLNIGIKQLRVTSDSRHLLVSGEDSIIQVNLESGAKVASFLPGTLGVRKFVINEDNTLIALANRGDEIKIWDMPSDSARFTIPAAESPVLGLVFASQQNQIISVHQRQLKIWSLTDGSPVLTQDLSQFVADVVPAQDGQGYYLVLEETADLAYVSFKDHKVVDTKRMGLDTAVWPNTIRRDANGDVFTFRDFNHLWVYRASDGRSLQFDVPAVTTTAHALSPDGTLVAIGSYEGNVQIWKLDFAKQKRIRLPHKKKSVDRLMVTPDRSRIITVSLDGEVLALDWLTDHVRCFLGPFGMNYGSIILGPDHKSIIRASLAGDITVWDLETCTLRFTMQGKAGQVQGLTLAPDGRTVITSSELGIMHWDAASGVHLSTWPQHRRGGLIKVSPDAKHLILTVHNSPSGRPLVVVIDFKSGTTLSEFEGHSDWVHASSISPDSRFLATGDLDATIKVWNLTTLAHEMTLKEDGGSVQSLVFSADGRTLISGSNSGTIRFWDLDSQSLALTIEGAQSNLSALYATDDLSLILTSGPGLSYQVWDLSFYFMAQRLRKMRDFE